MKVRKFFEHILKDYYETCKGKSSAIEGGIVLLVDKNADIYHISHFGSKIEDIFLENAILSSGVILDILKDHLAANLKFIYEKLGKEEFENYLEALRESDGVVQWMLDEALHESKVLNDENDEFEEDENDAEKVVM